MFQWHNQILNTDQFLFTVEKEKIIRVNKLKTCQKYNGTSINGHHYKIVHLSQHTELNWTFLLQKKTPFLCQNALTEPNLELNLEPASATVVTSEHHEVSVYLNLHYLGEVRRQLMYFYHQCHYYYHYHDLMQTFFASFSSEAKTTWARISLVMTVTGSTVLTHISMALVFI